MKGIRAYRFLDCSLIKINDINSYRFLSVCVSMGVDFFDMDIRMQENTEDEYLIYVKNSQLNKIKEASVKTGVDFEIVKETGVLAALKRNIKRKIFFISIGVAIVLLFLMTQFIWQIQISGCVSRSEAEILQLVNDKGVCYGVLRNKCDCDALEEAIRNEFEDVLWVSAAINGTGLFIQIKENTYLNDKLAITDKTADLVSDTDGTIISIVTREGVACCVAGDQVKKGDILISGVKEFYNDAKEVYKTEHTYADGDIIAECLKNYEWKYERNIKVRKYIKDRYGFKITFFNKKSLEYEPDNEELLFEKHEKNSVLVVGNDLYLPVNVCLSKYRIYEPEDRILSDESLTKLAKINYLMFCVRQASKGVDIIEKNATISFDKNYCTVNSSMITRERIGVHTDITVEPIAEEIRKESN